MKTAQKIVNNLMNENKFLLKFSSLRQDVWYLGITKFVRTDISLTKFFNIPVSFGLSTLAPTLNGYGIRLNPTNYEIANMHDFIYLHFVLFWSPGIPTMLLG